MMETILLAGIVILVLLTLVFLRIEIGFAIGMVTYAWLFSGGHNMVIGVSRFFGQLDMFVLLAIPFFLLAAELMNRSGITENIIMGANLTLGRFKGGLAQANVGGSLLFAGITGSAVADVAALGTVLVPSMAEEGYDRDYSAALTAASSLVGPIIPPSIILVIYGALTDTSIGALFAAAVVPGLLLALSLLVIVILQAQYHDFPRYNVTTSRSEIPKVVLHVLVAMTMPAIILLGLIFGVFTATEAAAIACVYAVFVGVAYRTLDLSKMYASLEDALERTAQLYIIIGFSGVFAWLLAREQIPALLVEMIENLGLGPTGFLLLILAVLLVTGAWLDISAAIIILAPPLHMMALDLGIHELHFGMVMTLAILMGLITPPVGMCLFVASSVSETDVWPIAKKIVPFFIVQVLVIVILILFPEFILYIPRSTGLA